MQTLPTSLREKGSFIGCIQKFVINERPISIISEALGGSNVDNCPHACVARPCGPLAQCVPNLENYECQCNPNNNNAQLCNKAEEVPPKVLEEAAVIAAAAHSTTEETTTQMEIDTTIVDDVLEVLEDEDDNNDGDIISSNKNKDYYYNDNVNDDEDYDNYEEGSGTTYRTTSPTPSTTIKTTTTTTTRRNIVKKKVFKTPIKSPYKELIEDIESHYTLKGKYMLLDSTIDKHTKNKKSKKAYESKIKKKPKFTLENDQEVNYVDSNNHHISSDFIFNTNDAEDDDETSTEVEPAPPKQHHAMRYRAEDDTIIDEILIDEMDKIMKDSSNEGNDDPWKTYQTTPSLPQTDTTKAPSETPRTHTGACFNGHDSYFHYSDAETMRRIISYQIDLNLRFKTHSNNGLILWSGRHSAQQDDDFLSLGIEEG